MKEPGDHQLIRCPEGDEALRASEERYRCLFTAMTEGFALHEILCDGDGRPCNYRFLDVNPAFERFTGLSRGEVIGRTMREVLPEEDRDWVEVYGDVAISGRPAHFDRYSAALRRHYEVHAYCPASGQFAVLFHDITGIKEAHKRVQRAEQELAETHRRLEALMLALPVGVSFSDDPTCQRITGNPAVLAQFEVRPEDNLSASALDPSAAGRQVRFFRDGREIGDAELPLQRAVAENREIPPVELEVQLPSGRRWFTDASGAPVRGPRGEVVGGVAVTVDITERKLAEQQLKTLAATLEQRIAERTAEAQRRAAQLRIMAAELSRAEQNERRRLAQVLHDHLQQILVAARMKVGLLRRRAAGNEPLAQLVDEVDELLDQSLSESRSLTVELSPPVLYDGGLAAALEWLGRRMEEQHGLDVDVCADAADDPPDQELQVFLFQAVRELLFNVVKHAQAQRAHVALAKTADGLLRIEVRDDGHGCEPAQFTGPAPGGGGFGLFNVRERLELLDGRMEVETAPGEGTCVVILVPLATPATAAETPDDAARPRHGRPPPGTVSQAKGGLRVLLADDHPLLRKGLADLLREQDEIAVVTEARDGQEAVELAREMRPDVVVMDITMPRLNGVEATRQIKADLPHIRVIALSMHEEADMARAMCQAGASDYLRKDAPAEVLLAAVIGAGSTEGK